MEKRRNPRGVKRTIDGVIDELNGEELDDEVDEVEDVRTSGDGAVMDELQVLFRMWKDKKP